MDNKPAYKALLAGPLLAVLLYLFLGRFDLDPHARLLCAVAAQTLLWWFTEAMPPAVAGLMFAVLATLFGVASAEKVFAPFASPIIYFFLGGFFLAKAIEIHGVAEKIIHHLDQLPFLHAHPHRISAALILITALLSAFLNNTATAALVLPFAVSLSRKSFSDNRAASVHLILGVSCAASLGGMLTIFGTAPNMIALGLLQENSNESISFLGWLKYSLPIALPLIFILMGRALWIGKNFKAPVPSVFRSAQSPVFSKAAKRSLCVLLGAMALLISVSLFKPLSFVGETNAILFPALCLFLIPSGSRNAALLTWQEAKDVDWACLILFGAGLSMGGLIFSTGLAKVFGQSLSVFGQHPHLFLVVLVASVILLTEFASNTASVALMVPLALAVAKEASLPAAPTVAAVALAASLGLMLPVGTPPNALAYGTGLLSTRQMIKNGVVLDVIGFVLCVLTFWLAF